MKERTEPSSAEENNNKKTTTHIDFAYNIYIYIYITNKKQTTTTNLHNIQHSIYFNTF